MIFIKKNILKYIILISFLLIIIYVFNYRNKYYDYYQNKLLLKTNLIVEGPSSPRGKIYDKNGIILVDNKTYNNLVFHYTKGIDLIDVSKKLSNLYEFSKVNEKELIKYYKAIYDEDLLFSKDEIKKIKERKISSNEKEELLNNRILNKINDFSEEDKNIAKVYNIITDGYLYEDKIVIEKIDDETINKIINENIPGIYISSSFERYYPYDDTLKGIFGKVGKIAKENKEEYLKNGYDLNDTVGISYLEKYYDKYLTGKKSKYLVNDDYTLTLLEKEEKGNDLYLSIDINLQLKIEEIVKKNIMDSKKKANTEYFSDSYVIIASPNTGSINAIVGKRLLKENEFQDIVINNIESSFTMGSSVKGATISVGYKYNLIDPNKKVLDGCVKLKNMTEKCSFKRLGYLNSVTAIESSSNYYQFLIAIALAGQTYSYDMDLNVGKEEFDKYRSMLASYGLGIKTGIDLPNEKIGLIGNKISPDLLLNLAIGQYDTYTPIEMSTYINTIASGGERRKPSLVTKIVDNDNNIVYENDYEVVEKIDIKDEDMKLIQQGMYQVMHGGTGNNSVNKGLIPAGKTGTSESFLDTNNDGLIDTKTISLTLVSYFPYENPQYSMIVICPNASHNNGKYEYINYVSLRISKQISDFLFENNIVS